MHRLLKKSMSGLEMLRYPRFASIKNRASGMLSPRVYARLYATVRALPDRDVLEIGAARGAATVVIARALLDSGKSSKVIAAEKFAGGSNVDFGERDENLQRIGRLFDHYGVREKVRLFPQHVSEHSIGELEALVSSEHLGLLMVDADGRLDVYLPLLWPRLPEGCPLVLDDYAESYDFAPRSERYPLGRTKELICFRLVNRLVELGYLEIDALLGHTVFARRRGSADFDSRDQASLREEVAAVEREYAAWLARGELVTTGDPPRPERA